MSGVAQGFTVIFILIAVGYVLGRTGVLGPDAQQVISRLVFFVFTPALLFHSLSTTDLGAIFSPTLVIAGGSAFIIGAVYFVIARVVLAREIPEATIGALASSYVNSANLGIPIAIFVLDDATFVAPLLLFQIMVYSPIALTVLDLTVLRDAARGRITLRDSVIAPLTNPIVLGGVAGLALSVADVRLPTAVSEPITMLGNASVPGALLAFGLSLTGVSVLRKGDSPRRDVALASVLKMVAQPLLVFTLAYLVFGERGHDLFAQVVIAALPTAQNVLVYATRYQRGEILARDTALVTTLASIPAIVVITALLA
ncbi:AEC family transporter [Williamsia sp. CHRR-6]|uniref:AEC family transporter n=1 Tax=Williamsia sp. CHRR-6 TaxID=2835871 RepID=UPI001BDB0FD4|nr:AEC family transporter [Williamsia sp. CHRR-6]MBT0566583.1 AEC family transporter [Williamsia sp. CHRR-6]